MKPRKLLIAGFFILAVFSIQLAYGEVPEIISYQGILKDANGVPLTGNYDITLRIYSQASGGEALWAETLTGVAVSLGMFNIMLGSATAFPANVDFSIPYWLGVSINAGAELTPRTQFASVGTAFMAKSVVDGSITEAKIANGQVLKSINGIKDTATLKAGSNVTISTSGDEIEIAATYSNLQISCTWAGWRKSFPAVKCGSGHYCTQNGTGLELYCSSGVVTQVRPISVCVRCEDFGR